MFARSLAIAAIAAGVIAGCATSGSAPSDFEIVAGKAADAAVAAALDCYARGCDRSQALDAAEQAALASLVASGIDAVVVDARYRPYVNAALLVLELSLAKSTSPEEAAIRQAVTDSVQEAGQ